MKLSNCIFDVPIVNNVVIYDETDSTNTRAKELGNNGCVHGTLILADQQTAGKGRMGRQFMSPKGHGIYMSLLVKPDVDASIVSQITLLSALAVSKAIDEVCDVKTSIKWPNDIILNGKKIVGILTELSCNEVSIPKTHGYADMDYALTNNRNTNVSYVVIGIGINVNNTSFPDTIEKTASSIYLETEKKFEFEPIITSILNIFSELYNNFVVAKNLDFIKDDYNKRLVSLNKQIYIIPNELSNSCSNPGMFDTSSLTPYLCNGIDAYGNLLCTDDANNIIIVNSGEVSVRGLNNYSS